MTPAGPPASAAAPVRRRLEPDERRKELLDAALEVLRQKGPPECRVADITTAAGTAKGNFYRYFDSFDDLLVGVRDHLLDRYRREVERRLEARGDAPDWWEVLDTEIDAFLDFQADLGPLHDVAFHSDAASSQPIEPDRSAGALIAAFLQAGIDDGSFAAVDVDATAALLFHVLHGAADQIAAGDDPERTREAARHLITSTLRRSRTT